MLLTCNDVPVGEILWPPGNHTQSGMTVMQLVTFLLPVDAYM